MSRDLVGEKTALDQTRIIANGMPKGLPLRMRNKIVHHILENQLKNFTNYSRFQRRKIITILLKKQTKPEQKSPSLLKKSSAHQGSNKKHGKNIAGQGSQ